MEEQDLLARLREILSYKAAQGLCKKCQGKVSLQKIWELWGVRERGADKSFLLPDPNFYMEAGWNWEGPWG